MLGIKGHWNVWAIVIVNAVIVSLQQATGQHLISPTVQIVATTFLTGLAHQWNNSDTATGSAVQADAQKK